MCHMAHSAALSLFCEKPFDDSDVIRVSEGFLFPLSPGESVSFIPILLAFMMVPRDFRTFGLDRSSERKGFL